MSFALLVGACGLFSACEREDAADHGVGSPAESAAPAATSASIPSSQQFRAIDYGMPNNAYCQPVRDWEPERIAFEEEVLRLSNELRAQGLECGSRGSFPPAQALTLNSALTCAARAHSKYMADNNVFDHIGVDGQNPGDRIGFTEYPVTAWGENIAFGYPTPAAVVEGWRNSESHCANLMRPYYTQMGVGLYATSSGPLHWTQVMATGEDRPPRAEPLPAPVLGGTGALVLALLGLGLGRAANGARSRD